MSDSFGMSVWSDVYSVSFFTTSFSSSRDSDFTEVPACSVISSSVLFTGLVVLSFCSIFTGPSGFRGRCRGFLDLLQPMTMRVVRAIVVLIFC